MKEGLVDFGQSWFGIPSAPHVELGAVRDIRLLPVWEEEGMFARAEEWHLTRYVVQPGVYEFVTEPTPTIQFLEAALMIPGALSEDEQYWLVKGLWNQRDFLISGFAAFEQAYDVDVIKDYLRLPGVNVAPGAMRFFKEQGWAP